MTKQNPRIIVHDIPIEYSSDEIVMSLVKQNFPDLTSDSFRVVYMYPLREEKKFRSCIIEMSPSCRSTLCKAQRVFIGLSHCRCEDHVSILQCFKCQKFGHVVKDCANKTQCGHCANEHFSRDCVTKRTLCCANCKGNNSSETNHSAFDKIKCPVLRLKIKQRTAFINYNG